MIGARVNRTAYRPLNKRAVDACTRQNTVCAEIALLGAGIQRNALRPGKLGKTACDRLLIVFGHGPNGAAAPFIGVGKAEHAPLCKALSLIHI